MADSLRPTDIPRWLTGGGLISFAAGYISLYSVLLRLYKVPGKRATLRASPPMLGAALRRIGSGASLLLLGFIFILRQIKFGQGSHVPSFMEELIVFLREMKAMKGSLLLMEDILAVVLVLALTRHVQRAWSALTMPWAEKKAFVEHISFEVLRMLPVVARSLQKEVEKTEAYLETALKPAGDGPPLRSLPEKGRSAEELLTEMRALSNAERSNWSAGKASGAVYNDRQEHASVVTNAFALFSHSNPLHPDLWPSSLKFEREVISMTARLLDGGNAEVCGIITSGGTESIILAAKAHRDYFRQRGITSPEIVAATSAHAAIEKASTLMGIRLIKVPVDPKTMKADVGAMARAMSTNTILIYASAPNFPHGIIDPVEALGKLALQYRCGLHVDCCLGGFVLPFARALGYSLPDFDFTVPGVTSMSADTHKYGYAPKGTSVALFRHKELRHHAYFCFPDWTGGLYVTPTIAGSRPGALTAACWAAMTSMGEEGYLEAVKSIMFTAKEIAQGVDGIAGLKLIGEPGAMIVCFGGQPGVNIYKVGDGMKRRGWSLNALQNPPCLHLCVTLCHAGKGVGFLKDLKASTAQAIATGGKADANSTAAIYGMASSMPAGPVNVLLRAYADVTLGK